MEEVEQAPNTYVPSAVQVGPAAPSSPATMSTSNPPAHDAPDGPQHDHELIHRLRALDDMIRASEETEDKLRRVSERRRIPPVPDLRFEYSYTRSVSQYVHVERVPAPSREKGKERAVDGGEDQDIGVVLEAGEVVRVDWGRVIWITTRDQVISPLLQGALWCVITLYMCRTIHKHALQGSCEPFPAAIGCAGGCAHTRLVVQGLAQERRTGGQRRTVVEELDRHHLDTDSCDECLPPVEFSTCFSFLLYNPAGHMDPLLLSILMCTRLSTTSWPAT